MKSNRALFIGSILVITIIFLDYFSFKEISTTSVFNTPAIFVCGIVMIGITIFNLLFREGVHLLSLDITVLLFIGNMLVSFWMANFYWDQSFFASLVGYRYFYIYFLYFFFIFLNFTSAEVEKILKIFFFLSLVVFLVDLITFPDPIFANRDEERRGGITVFFSGQGFTFLGGFYYLNRFVNEKKKIYLLFFFLAAYCLFFLTQSRMNLAGIFLGGLFILLFSQIRYRYIITGLAVIALIGVYSFTDIFESVKETNKMEMQYYEENIRLSAQEFYLYELQGGRASVLFGNGYPGKNSKLEKLHKDGNLLGYFVSDVGVIGLFSFFGIIGVLLWLSLFIKVIRLPSLINAKSNYPKAYFLSLLPSAIAGYSLIDSGYMAATVFALFITRCSLTEANTISSSEPIDKKI